MPSKQPNKILLDIAAKHMLAMLMENTWYNTSPAGKNGIEPKIKIVGIEYREFHITQGILSMGHEMRPCVIAEVTIDGITAEMSMQVTFGIGGLTVEEQSTRL